MGLLLDDKWTVWRQRTEILLRQILVGALVLYLSHLLLLLGLFVEAGVRVYHHRAALS